MRHLLFIALLGLVFMTPQTNAQSTDASVKLASIPKATSIVNPPGHVKAYHRQIAPPAQTIAPRHRSDAEIWTALEGADRQTPFWAR